MLINRKPVMMGGGFLSDLGHGLMKIARSGTDLFTKIRGDKDDVVVEGPAPVNYANLAVYGTLAAIALLVVVKKK